MLAANRGSPLAQTARRIVALGVLLGACSGGGGGGGGGTPTAPTPVLTAIVVSLSPSSIPVGQTSVASASGLDQNGASISVGSVVWSSASPAIATVNATGVVTGVAPGQASIAATSGSRTGQQFITVTPAPVANVTVAPTSATLAIGATQQLTATTLDANGNTLTGRVVAWSTSDSTKATVSTSGLVTAVAGGTATITATSETKTGSSTITVNPPPVASVTVTPAAASLGVGSSQQLTATLRDANGNAFTGTAIAWSTSDATRATVSQSGLVTAVAIGSATITASSGGKTGIATITVTTAVSIISYGTATQHVAVVDIGGTFVPTVSAVNGNGQPAATGPLTFTSRAPSIVSVTASGAITALAGGQSWVVVTASTSSDSVFIVVPLAATSPLFRTSLTSFEMHAGDSLTTTIVLDTRGTTIGAATIEVGFTLSNGSFTSARWAMGGPPTPQWSNQSPGALLISLATATGMTGTVTVATLTLYTTSTSKGAAGLITVTAIDVIGVNGTNLLPLSTSTQYPINIIP